MSGWRSGSGRRTSLVEDALADPASVVRPARRAQVDVRALVLILSGAVVVAAAIGLVEASRRPPHRVLPPPADSAVTIVPVGELPDALLDGVVEDYASVYGLHLTIATPVRLDPGLVGPDGRSVAAEAIAHAVSQGRARGALVVAVTGGPILTGGPEADGDMAERFSGTVAVISTWPLVSMKTISRRTLFRRALTRQLGFLVWRLPATADPYDLLFDRVENEVDLERVSDHL